VEESPIRSWEYFVEEVQGTVSWAGVLDPDVTEISRTLNALGREGWELGGVASYRDSMRTLLFLKRPRQPVASLPELPAAPPDGLVECVSCGQRVPPEETIDRVTGPICRTCDRGPHAGGPNLEEVPVDGGSYRDDQLQRAEKLEECVRCQKRVPISKAFRSSMGAVCPECQALES
jgi:hypothetical protein